MAAINFPDSPSDGDTHVVGQVTYTYNSAETKWKTSINANNFLPTTGGTLTGNLNMGTNDLTVGDINGLTYPTSDGTTGQYLQTDGAGALSFQTVPNNGFASYAVICDQKTSTTNAGTFTSGAWRTRDLNTEIFDPDNIVSISSNEFTLAAGTYLIEWSAPAMRVNGHKTRLYDVTANAAGQLGNNAYCISNTSGDQTHSFGSARITIASSNTYRIEHRCEVTSNTFGLGYRTNLDTEIYTVVKIFKEA